MHRWILWAHCWILRIVETFERITGKTDSLSRPIFFTNALTTIGDIKLILKYVYFLIIFTVVKNFKKQKFSNALIDFNSAPKDSKNTLTNYNNATIWKAFFNVKYACTKYFYSSQEFDTMCWQNSAMLSQISTMRRWAFYNFRRIIGHKRSFEKNSFWGLIQGVH